MILLKSIYVSIMNRLKKLPFSKYLNANYHSTVGVYGFRPRSISQPYIVPDNYLKNRKLNNDLYQLALAFKEHGHKAASLNPLVKPSEKNISLLNPMNYNIDLSGQKEFLLDGIIYANNSKATVNDLVDHLKKIYCNKIGVEFHYLNEDEKEWFANEFEKIQLETKLSNDEKKDLAIELLKSQTFDNFLATKFSTIKRYGGEGAESMMAFFLELFKQSHYFGVSEIMIGIPHRGRLNLLVGLLKFPPVAMFQKMMGFSEFPKDRHATGDVLSHLTSSININYGKNSIHVTLLPNPSHLEAISPVVAGYARGRLQSLKVGDYSNKNDYIHYPILPIQVHGDASFSGQGVVMETLAMSKVSHFYVGGSIHLIVNNQIGFTTPQDRGRSSSYCSDIMKMISAPVIHVNGDYPEEVVKATRLALSYRQQFHKDILIDLICFRRWGHNELDDPTFTNPLMYKTIHARKSVPDLYSENLVAQGILREDEWKDISKSYYNKFNNDLKEVESYEPCMSSIQHEIKTISHQSTKSLWDTGVSLDLLKFVGAKSVDVPENFVVHSTLTKNFIQERNKKLSIGDQIDWATAEALAIGTLLYQNHNVRISGQDVGRGTFSHRHAMMVDQMTNEIYIPLNHMIENQNAFYEIANSILSEEAVLSFEYGFSIENLNNLVIWEAQFGDFFNAAQVVFDTFISSGETKWLLKTGLVVLLPHGYDGAGPEHSSCRIERFLQMSDSYEDKIDSDNVNWHVVNPTTPAQYFHLLRKQVISSFRKPLIVIAPKILLRHPSAISSLNDMAPGTYFQPILYDKNIDTSSVKTLIFCSGKHFYLLQKEKESCKKNDIAIIRLEAICPFPANEIYNVIKMYKNVKTFVWSQEEPQNMGCWTFVKTRFENLLGCKLRYAGRKPLAAPAVGIGKLHQQEINEVLNETFK